MDKGRNKRSETVRIVKTTPSILFALLLCLLPVGPLAASDPVVRLQDSFDETPAARRKIYTGVAGEIERRLAAGEALDDRLLLARAVALKQRAMDAEDQFIASILSSAPRFANLPISNPPFLADYREASRAFREIESRQPFVAPYALSARIIADHWGDGEAFLKASLEFKERWPLSRFWRRLLLLSGCRLAAQRQWEQARRAFEPLWEEAPTSGQAIDSYRLVWALKGPVSLDIPPERMLDWGRGLGLSGRQAFVNLIEAWPDSPQAETAYLEIGRTILRGFAIRSLSVNFTQADRLDRYLAEFEKKYPSGSLHPDMLIVCADFMYQCGKKSMAISRKNDNSWRRNKNQTHRNTAQRYKQHADGYFEKVRRIDRTMSERYHGTGAYFQAGILHALTLIEQDRFDQALDRLSSLLREKPDPESLNQIYWYFALTDYLKLDYRAVIRHLEPIEQDQRRDATYWCRAMLFLGKAYLHEADTVAAARVFTGLSRAYPYNYYGIRARYLRDGLSLSPPFEWVNDLPPIEVPRFPTEYTAKGAVMQQDAGSWRSLGFHAEAAYIYNNAVTVVPEDDLLRFRLHENLHDAGWYNRVLRSFRGPFRQYLQRGGNGLPEGFWELAYLKPEPFSGFIDKHGRKNGIPPALITAVMRQESNFHPRARSHAGAIGLMQLLPSVGRRLGSSAGYGNVTADRLYDPDINIALGTVFLASNLRRYNGNIPLAISCYNADPRNLPAWLERSHSEREDSFDLDLFIELIPLEETYDYNLQVLTNFWRYQEVYGEKEDLLKWKLSSTNRR